MANVLMRYDEPLGVVKFNKIDSKWVITIPFSKSYRKNQFILSEDVRNRWSIKEVDDMELSLLIIGGQENVVQ